LTQRCGTDGNLITYDTSGDPAAVATGSDGQVLTSGGAGVAPTFASGGLPKNYIAGLKLTNDTDSDHDIQIGLGECRSSDDATDMVVSTVITKRIDATWAAGDDAGGMEDGDTVGATELFYVHLLSESDGTNVDMGFDTSPTAVNILADSVVNAASLTKYRLIGYVVTDSSSNIYSFTQTGDYFRLTSSTIPSDISDSTLTSNTFETGTLSVPRYCLAHVYLNVAGTANASCHGTIRPADATEASTQGHSFTDAAGSDTKGTNSGNVGMVLVDGSSQIDYAAFEGVGTMYLDVRTFGCLMLTRSDPS